MARYTPSVEKPEEDEAETARALDRTMQGIQEKTCEDYGQPVRSVHAKAHGFLQATLEVADGLPPELAQGLFARAGRYPAVMRFSTPPGDILDDGVSSPRGLAVKVIGVPGERLPGSEEDATQDFVLVNGPAFNSSTGKQFLTNLKLLAATTDKGEGAKKVLSSVLQTVEGALETVGLQSGMLSALGGAPQVHPLGETYYSQTPFLYGEHIAKFALFPISKGLTEVTKMKVVTHNRPDALREDVAETMIEQDGVWELRVQLCTDLEKMPIENASVVWDEKESPYRTVATLTAPAQPSWTLERVQAVDQGMAFSPWHGLAAHRPLGSVNRMRKDAYKRSAGFRGCPIHEPQSLDLG